MSTNPEVKDSAGANHEESGSQAFHMIHGHLVRRQGEMLAIPTTYMGLHSGPSPGIVVGIMLGSLAGFLLLLWLIYAIFNIAGGFGFRALRRRTSAEVVINAGRRRRGPRRRASDAAMDPPFPGGADEDVIEVIEEVDEGRRRRRPPRRVFNAPVDRLSDLDLVDLGPPRADRPMREYARHIEEESPAEEV